MLRRAHPKPINFVFLFPKITGGQLSPPKLEKLLVYHILLLHPELKN